MSANILNRRDLISSAIFMGASSKLFGAEILVPNQAVNNQPLNVVYVGNDIPDADQFDAWLGRRTDGVLLHTGYASWSDWSGSIGWLADRWQYTNRQIFWSIPLFPNGSELVAAANGQYDDKYRQAAKDLLKYSKKGTIFVRTGWEFNGSWMPWAAAGREAAFIGAYQKFVTVFRNVSNRFKFEWTPNIGDVGMNPEMAYPGNNFVDIIGMDFYYHPQWLSSDPNVAWNYMVEQRFGLQWHQTFAKARGKPTAYSEWGVALDTSGPYIAHAAEWFRKNPTFYHSYWNSDADFTGKLSNGRIPKAGAAYIAEFGMAAK